MSADISSVARKQFIDSHYITNAYSQWKTEPGRVSSLLNCTDLCSNLQFWLSITPSKMTDITILGYAENTEHSVRYGPVVIHIHFDRRSLDIVYLLFFLIHHDRWGIWESICQSSDIAHIQFIGADGRSHSKTCRHSPQHIRKNTRHMSTCTVFDCTGIPQSNEGLIHMTITALIWADIYHSFKKLNLSSETDELATIIFNYSSQ